jgi:hypothetical protein
MHAVVVRVSISDIEAAENSLRDIVPQVSQAPGFVTGHWTRKGNSGLAMIIAESEEDANGIREKVPSMVPADAVTLEDVEVREVVAHA